jgi:hypothetical protein
MEILRHEDIDKDFRKLNRFPAPQESLEAWEKLLLLKGVRETPGINQCSGFGEKIYKGRVVPLKEKFGKSKGYRVIFQIVEEKYKILVFGRHGIYKTENELIKLIKERLQ